MLFTNTDCLCFAKDPAVVRYRSRYWLYYSLRHEDGRFGIGIAESADMEHWTPCGEIEQDALCETNGILSDLWQLGEGCNLPCVVAGWYSLHEESGEPCVSSGGNLVLWARY